MCVIFTANYFFSEGRRLCRQRNALGDRLRESQDQADSVFLEMLIWIEYTCVFI
jgi:hypothetical protein